MVLTVERRVTNIILHTPNKTLPSGVYMLDSMPKVVCMLNSTLNCTYC
jgi:hypothetical protein